MADMVSEIMERKRHQMRAIYKLGKYAVSSGSGWSVGADSNHINSCIVKILGQKVFSGAYGGGVWKVRMTLPEDYPQSPPRLNFLNKIIHPNIHGESGSVCLSALNKSEWKSGTDLGWIFEFALPYLLLHPNFDDPMNSEAFELHRINPQAYDAQVERYVMESAQEDAMESARAENGMESEVAMEPAPEENAMESEVAMEPGEEEYAMESEVVELLRMMRNMLCHAMESEVVELLRTMRTMRNMLCHAMESEVVELL